MMERMKDMPGTPHKDHDHSTLLRAAKLRVTPVRLGVLRALCQTHEALSADQIIENLTESRGGKAKGRRPDRVTVYRTLNALVEAGIAHKLDPGDRIFRFGLAGDHASHAPVPGVSCGCGPSENCAHSAAPATIPNLAEQSHGHPHFLCESCGKVECLDDTEVVLQTKPGGSRSKSALNIRQQEVLLKGTCEECDPADAPKP